MDICCVFITLQGYLYNVHYSIIHDCTSSLILSIDTEGVVTVSIDLEVLWAKLLSFKEIG